MSESDNGWGEYRNLVLAEIRRVDRDNCDLRNEMKALGKTIALLRSDLAGFKGRVAAYAGMAGVITSSILYAVLKFAFG